MKWIGYKSLTDISTYFFPAGIAVKKDDIIEKTKKSLTTQQNNLNAVYGAIQQIDKLIPMVDTEKKDTRVLLNEKDKAVSASLA